MEGLKLSIRLRTPWMVMPLVGRTVVRRVPQQAVLILTLGMMACGPSDPYVDTVRAFYRGLASLDAGLLDDAREQFTRATDLSPNEPAVWANLGVSRLRMGAFDEATGQIGRAVSLAPEDPDLRLLLGLAENARGEVDAAITHFRAATALEPGHLRVRFALADAIERAGDPGADDEAQQHVDTLLRLTPDNLAAQVERARLAAKRGDLATLADAAAELTARGEGWPDPAGAQLAELAVAVDQGSAVDAARAIAFLRNVLARVPEYQDGLTAIRTPAELVAEPLERFRVLAVPGASASPADTALTFVSEPIGTNTAAVVATSFTLNAAGGLGLLEAVDNTVRRLDPAGGQWPFPSVDGTAPTAAGILPLDWNSDFRTDILLAGTGGVRLLLQNEDGTLTDTTAAAWGDLTPANLPAAGAWAADLDLDGDLDVVVGRTTGSPLELRNNGDGTWMPQDRFPAVEAARAMAWADLDRDGDPDPAFLDAEGAVHVFENRQGGRFDVQAAPEDLDPWLALTTADTDADGQLELLGLDTSGDVSRFARTNDGGWNGEAGVATWPEVDSQASPGSYRLWAVDIDNSGSLDLVAAGGATTRVWLASAIGAYAPLFAVPDGEAFAVRDVTNDGRLDLIGIAGGTATRFVTQGTRDYHWHVIRPRARTDAGDQRINTFGQGGEIEVRSGLLVQKQVLTGDPAHFGLGAREEIEVVRILWPNGVSQAEFDLGPDTAVEAEQRLKGSCPWLFTWNGDGLEFVTDFLWRSPLGLAINAQETAGVVQTEDRVRIRSDQLVPRDGVYDVRITAELWETHFFDHVSLLAVDHPSDVAVFVDERFAVPPPTLDVRATALPRPVAGAWDGEGREVTEVVRERDGRYLDTFELGQYQGVTAQEHTVELALGDGLPIEGQIWLLAHGWIYPTDSSINVAIAQGSLASPRGLALDVLEASGTWRTVYPDLGFPAGKQKTILIDISDVAHSTERLRLRTNLEIYWDWIGYAEAADTTLRTTRLAATRADLRYRGFSRTEFLAARGPEVPLYGAVANTTQHWRDLEGYHTRFGDVRELLTEVDDRYVIMNAGDELQLEFPALPSPPDGWIRDFVLIGDGWVKDGDFNTTASRTVGPLPSHAQPDYVAPGDRYRLEDDPVYQAHADDWRQYHTRYVTPQRFLDGLGGGRR